MYMARVYSFEAARRLRSRKAPHWAAKVDIDTFFGAQGTKKHASNLKPDFFARCMPVDGHCSRSGPRVIEGHRAFPSGAQRSVLRWTGEPRTPHVCRDWSVASQTTAVFTVESGSSRLPVVLGTLGGALLSSRLLAPLGGHLSGRAYWPCLCHQHLQAGDEEDAECLGLGKEVEVTVESAHDVLVVGIEDGLASANHDPIAQTFMTAYGQVLVSTRLQQSLASNPIGGATIDVAVDKIRVEGDVDTAPIEGGEHDHAEFSVSEPSCMEEEWEIESEERKFRMTPGALYRAFKVENVSEVVVDVCNWARAGAPSLQHQCTASPPAIPAICIPKQGMNVLRSLVHELAAVVGIGDGLVPVSSAPAAQPVTPA